MEEWRTESRKFALVAIPAAILAMVLRFAIVYAWPGGSLLWRDTVGGNLALLVIDLVALGFYRVVHKRNADGAYIWRDDQRRNVRRWLWFMAAANLLAIGLNLYQWVLVWKG